MVASRELRTTTTLACAASAAKQRDRNRSEPKRRNMTTQINELLQGIILLRGKYVNGRNCCFFRRPSWILSDSCSITMKNRKNRFSERLHWCCRFPTQTLSSPSHISQQRRRA